MRYQKKLIFIRLLSFVLFLCFGINILLTNYLELTWAIYVLIILLVLNIAVAITGIKMIPNVEIELSKTDEKINKGILFTLIFIWIGNYILSSQTLEFKNMLHLTLGITMIVIAIVGIFTQYFVIKREK